MQLLAATLASLAASLAAVAFAVHLVQHAGTAASGPSDAWGWLSAMLGGPFVLGLSIYAVLAFALVTAGAFRDLSRARIRMHRAVAEAPSIDWSAIFAGTAFAAIAAQLVPDEMRLAPLSLLRVLRTEMWRTYLTRLAAVEAVVLLLAAGMIAARPTLPVLTASAPDGPLAAGTALFLGAMLAFAWLMLDGGFARAGTEITQACGWWSRPVPEPATPGGDVALARPDPALGAADSVAAGLAELRPVLARIEESLMGRETGASLTEALARVAAALDRLAAAPAPRRDEMQEALRGMGATLAAVAEAVHALEKRPRSVTDDLDELLEEISDLAPRDAATRG